MVRVFQDKRWVAVIALAALIALTVLAVSLHQIQFRAGQTYSQKEARDNAEISIKAAVDAWVAVPWWKQAGV